MYVYFMIPLGEGEISFPESTNLVAYQFFKLFIGPKRFSCTGPFSEVFEKVASNFTFWIVRFANDFVKASLDHNLSQGHQDSNATPQRW